MSIDSLNRDVELNNELYSSNLWNLYTNLEESEERIDFQYFKNEKLNEERTHEQYEKVTNLWLVGNHEQYYVNPFLNLQRILNNFKITSFSQEAVDLQVRKATFEILYTYSQMNHNNLIDENNQIKLMKILEIIYYDKKTLSSMIRSTVALDPQYDSFMNNDKLYIDRFKPLDIENNTPCQNLMYYILSSLYNDNLRRYNGECYAPIYTKNNVFTHSWKHHGDLQSYIFQKTNKDLHEEQWKNRTSNGSNIRQCIEELTHCNDFQFQEINKDRNTFSFKNGIYFTKIYEEKEEEYTDLFVPYSDSETIRKHIGDMSASKYFDEDMPSYNGCTWDALPTPNFDKIIDYQFNNRENGSDFAEIYRFMFVFLGRMLFDVGDLDGWQVIPFLKGLAGTGKGTIIKLVKKFYELEDQGILSNAGERQFGVSAFANKKIFIISSYPVRP